MIKSFSLILLTVTLFPLLVTTFVIVPSRPGTLRGWMPAKTALMDRQRIDSETAFDAPSNFTSSDVGIDDDVVAHRTIKHLESVGPDDFVDEDEIDDEFDPATQIFDPLSFWTERTGRFPRNK